MDTRLSLGPARLANAPYLGKCLNAALAFFYPEICQNCRAGRAGAAEGFVCGSCRETVKYLEPPWCERCGRPFEGAINQKFECSQCMQEDLSYTWARSAAAANGVVLEMIHRYKYQRALWVEPFLANILLREALPRLATTSWDYLVPVPLHPRKQREREFNQAERLALRLSKAIGIPVNTRFVRRVEFTRTQTQLTREERQANVRKAFKAMNNPDLKEKRLLLVDDVFTTGSTTNACARALRQGGAADVCVWTLARGI